MLSPVPYKFGVHRIKVLPEPYFCLTIVGDKKKS